MLARVSQRALHRRRVELVDRPLPGASLFPLFDAQGRTRALMLASTQDARIALVGWRPGLVERVWPWRLRMDVRSTDLRDAESSDAERFGDLWHFDPWWVLAEQRYVGHAAVPPLKQTNLPGWDAAVTGVWFTPRLDRAVQIGFGEGEALRVRRVEPASLAEASRAREEAAASQEPERPARAGWRLRPFWQRAPR